MTVEVGKFFKSGSAQVFSVISVVAGLVGVAGMVGFGVAALAVFAVGAGHVALVRSDRDGRPLTRTLASIGLALGYGVAIWSLVIVVGIYLPLALTQ